MGFLFSKPTVLAGNREILDNTKIVSTHGWTVYENKDVSKALYENPNLGAFLLLPDNVDKSGNVNIIYCSTTNSDQNTFIYY